MNLKITRCQMAKKKIRHICGISGGKDSAALAIYLKQKGDIPEMEYYFSDTGCELPETYDFIDRLEAYLGKKITRLGGEGTFEHHLDLMRMRYEDHLEEKLSLREEHENQIHRLNESCMEWDDEEEFPYEDSTLHEFSKGKIEDHGVLPSPTNRWCTVKMKLEPFEEYVGEDEVFSYVAIRADEHREGYVSTKDNIHPVFPFVHDDIVRRDVFRILEETVGIPEYYKWRSRSGCYFCFFQRREEWLGLYDNHPELFKKAVELEEENSKDCGYTWIENITLTELLMKRDKVIEYAGNRKNEEDDKTWQEKLLEQGDDLNDQGCLICSL